MYNSLILYIQERSSIPLSEADMSLIREAFIPKKFRKRQYLLPEGEVCKYIAFIVKGATRQYTVDQKGYEKVLNLCIENWWTSDRESFHKETPSIYNIDAWESAEVLLLPKANGYYDRVNAIPAFNQMRIKLDDNNRTAQGGFRWLGKNCRREGIKSLNDPVAGKQSRYGFIGGFATSVG